MTPTGTLFAPFLGRDEELRFLRERHAAAARDLEPCTVLLFGEAGLGKTRLLDEFCAQARRKRGALVRATCQRDGQRAFQPLVDALTLLADHRDAHVSRCATVARDVLLADEGTSDVAASERRRQRLTRFATAFGDAARRLAHLTLVIDDAQWSDIDTLEALRLCAVAARGAPLFLLLACRPEDVAQSLARTAAIAALERDGAYRIVLPPLADASILEALVAVLPRAKNTTLRRICSIAEGRPFYAEELARDALQATHDRPQPSRTLRDALLERANALEPQQREILSRAAVFGRTIPYADIAVLGSYTREEVLATLRAARDLQIIVEVEDKHSVAFAYRHALSREIFYEDLDAGKRRELHASIAEYLDDRPGRIAELAYHLWSAGPSERALEASEVAGDEALGVTALADALAHYERALSIATGPDLVRIARKFVNATIALGEADVLESVERVANQLLGSGEIEAAARAFFDLANWLALALRIPDAERMCARGTELVDDRSSPEIRFERALCTLSICNRQLRYADARQSYAEALKLLGAATRNQKLRLEFAHATTLHGEGCEENIAERFEACLALARELGETGIEGQILTTLALVAFAVNYHEALHWMELALALRERIGESAGASSVRASIAVLALVTGDLARGDASLAEATRAGQLPAHWLAVQLMLARYLGRDVAPFLVTLDEPGSSKNPWVIVTTCVNAVWALKERDARALIARAVEELDEKSYRGKLSYVVARFGSDADFARVRNAIAHWQPLYPLQQADHTLFLACAAARERRYLESTTLAHEALALYEGIGDWLGSAHALALAGERERACEILRRVGATAELARFGESSESASDEVTLSTREEQVAQLYATGLSYRKIGERLGIGARTVETHVAKIYAKMRINNRTQLVERMRVRSASVT